MAGQEHHQVLSSPGDLPPALRGTFGKMRQRGSRTECKFMVITLLQFNEDMFLEGEMSSQKVNCSVNDTLSSANVEFV